MGRTQDGFESQFGSNFLGHFALTGQLIDVIRATPDCRVVHVGSLAHRIGRIDLDDPNFERRRNSPWRGYGQRSEEHTSELQSLMRISYAVFCLKKKTLQQPKLMVVNLTQKRHEYKHKENQKQTHHILPYL